MKFDDDTWQFVCSTLDDIKERSDELGELSSQLKIAIDSPLFDSSIEADISLIRALAFLVHRTYNLNMEQVLTTLNWFVFDNDYGKNKLSASGITNELKEITSYHDLKRYLEEEIEDDVRSAT